MIKLTAREITGADITPRYFYGVATPMPKGERMQSIRT